jgi:carbamoyltransferase
MNTLKTNILSLSYEGHDTAAAVMSDGNLIAACEQERFDLEKHSRNFPLDAVNKCLEISGLDINEIDELAVPFDPILSIRENYLRPGLEDKNRIAVLINDINKINENN